MHVHMLDTHKFIKGFQAESSKEKQAELIAKFIVDSKELDFSRLATREQVTELKKDVELAEERISRKISEMQFNMLKWLIPFFIGVIVAIIYKG